MRTALLLVDVQRNVLEGQRPVPACGAHATYDDSDTADAISAAVDRDLRQAGVRVQPAEQVDYR